MESDAKINLSNLSKIPPKEFEKNFREWLDRDDVARSLQAQLRMDLIKNFNKTALGRQMLSQTSSTNKLYGGSSTQRLTLSPIVLALNTLVAEFLYAENCHFSLSVFSTEIPFRNTLPDFESPQHFRFTELEICEILEAVYGTAKYEKDIQNKIIKEYEANVRSSLLLLILKHPLSSANREKEEKSQTSQKSVKSPEVTQKSPKLQKSPKSPESPESLLIGDGKEEFHFRTKAKKSTSKLHYVNKYLIAVSKKLQCMSRQLYLLQQQKTEPQIMPRPRCLKTASQHSMMKLNRSLEVITGNLKKIAVTKRKNKRIDVIVKAIETMSNQFEKCAANFEKIPTNVVSSNENMLKKEMSTTMPEKSYSEWINELRSSKYGQRFLDKVENSLRKALNKQKQFLAQELDTKLSHQKELLKIRYKEKLMKHLPRRDASAEFDKLNKSVEKQLEQFELKHCEMVQRLHDEEQSVVKNALPSKIVPATIVEIKPQSSKTTSTTTIAAKPTEALVITLKSPEPKSSSRSPMVSPKLSTQPTLLAKSATSGQEFIKVAQQLKGGNLTVHTLKSAENHLDKMLQRIAADEQKVDNIVLDAKLRLQQLEIESNQLEQNFHQYLERQQKQKQICREASATMWNNYLLEKNKIENKYEMLRHATQSVPPVAGNDLQSDIGSLQNVDREYEKLMRERMAIEKVASYMETIKDDVNSSSSSYCKNAILEAKAKLFQHDKIKNNDKDTKKNIGKKPINTELKKKPDAYNKPMIDTRKLSPKLRNLDESKKIRKRTKAVENKITSASVFVAKNVDQSKYKKGPYASETEETGVETNDISSSEVETEVLLAPYSSSGIRAKVQPGNNKLHEKTQEHLKAAHPRQRLKPWTTTTGSTEHKVMQRLFIKGQDNVGDYNGSTAFSPNKLKLWGEEKPSTSKILQHTKPTKVLPKTPTIIPNATTTTMVLQQSMAKMNRLFQNEQQRRRQITKKHKIKEQKQQQMQLQTMLHFQKRVKDGKRTIEETTTIAPITSTATTIATNTSNVLVFQQDLAKHFVSDYRDIAANAVVKAEEMPKTAATATAALAANVVKSQSENDKNIEKEKSAAEKLTETVATLSTWRTAITNEPATDAAATEQIPTVNADDKKKVDDDQQQVQEQQQHAQEQQKDNQQLQQQQQDLRQQISSQHVATSQAETSSLHIDINDDDDDVGAIAAGNSLAITTATSQLDADVGECYDIDAHADEYDDLVLAPIVNSTMSMTSLLALQFSTGYDKYLSSAGGNDNDEGGNDNDEGGNQDGDGSREFWD